MDVVNRVEEIEYINGNGQDALRNFSKTLYEKIPAGVHGAREIVVLCIGSDRATGDCLGPIIGHKLNQYKILFQDLYIYGSLENPVHAKNLEDTIAEIYKSKQNPFIIAIDACLGRADHVGYLTIGSGPVKPGAGVNKVLPEVGDIAITGIVNCGGFLDMMVIQSTRLGLVMKMADIITFGIVNTMKKLISGLN